MKAQCRHMHQTEVVTTMSCSPQAGSTKSINVAEFTLRNVPQEEATYCKLNKIRFFFKEFFFFQQWIITDPHMMLEGRSLNVEGQSIKC